MNESDYNPYLHETLKECVVCMEVFLDGVKVTALPCDERHYFHSECILSWSERNRNCPLCKKDYNVRDIKKFNKKFVKLRMLAEKRRNSVLSSGSASSLHDSSFSLETCADDDDNEQMERLLDYDSRGDRLEKNLIYKTIDDSVDEDDDY